MIERKIMIQNRLGLHARAAAKLVATASRFSATIEMNKNDKTIDAKSIMAVMMLAANQGTEIILKINGEDEEEAMTALCELIDDRFGEGQ